MSLDNFIRLADRLVEFEADLNDKQMPISSCHTIDIHREELKNCWANVKTAYDEHLYNQDNEDDDKVKGADLETLKAKYKNTYITFCRCLTKLSEAYEELQAKNSPKPTQLPDFNDLEHKISKPKDSSYGFQLPPFKIEPFDGDYASWPKFRDLFTALCINNSRASGIEKLFTLISCTKGEAKVIAEKTEMSNEGFQNAWSTLCRRYENKRALINGQLTILFNLKPFRAESRIALRNLQADINSCINTLKLYDIDIASWNPIFVFVCTNCLPDETLIHFEQTISDKTIIPEWSKLDSFLTDRCRTLESVSNIRKPLSAQSAGTNSQSSNKTPTNSKRINTFQTKVGDPKCPLCSKESHVIRKCPRFLKMNMEQRFSEIKKQRLCINCFSKAHAVKSCTSKHSCFKCQKQHNTLLHRDSANPKANPSAQQPVSSTLNPNSASFPSTSNSAIQSANNSGARVQNFFTTNNRGVLLGTAMVDVCYQGTRVKARALIDPCSEGSFISENILKLLRLPSRRTRPQDVSGMGDFVSASPQRMCSFILSSPLDYSIEIPVNALVVPQVSASLPSRPIDSSYFSDLPQIHLADPEFYKSLKVDILIGGEVYPSIMLSANKHDVCNSLMAQETIFGWILTGPVSPNSQSLNSTVASFMCKVSLDQQISRFWEVENLPRKNFVSESDKYCEDLFVKTTKRGKNGRYVVSLPFKEGYPQKLTIGQSRNSSLAQFFRNEARLLRTPTFKSEYDQVIQEYSDLGHMFKVSPPDSFKVPMHYYLPHHAVIKPESTTTKVRVVFNASSSSSNGLSLNDILHTGPVLQSDLTLLLHKWRFFKFVFNADIQKMYRQILVNPDHTSFQRILFRDNPNDKVQDYELKTVTFGVNCAPYLAIRTMLQLADDVESTYPIASDILRNSMYVDDALVGAHTISTAIKSRDELINALKSAGFSLRKWTSNSKKILSDLPTDHLLYEDFLDFDDSSTAKMLGIRWNALSDEFYFSTKPFPETGKYTKREVLSQISKLFDPAGWLAPCIILAKIIMQRIWMEGTDWDEVLSPDTVSQWKIFQSSYTFLNEIRIPRWIDYVPSSKVQFHCFCDASEKAYAAAIYIRIDNGNSISSHLVSAKTKVAPIKTLSIPRLELCGAVLLAEMLDSIVPRLEISNYSIYCWTDSTIVLSWLAKPPCLWMTFVANRISKIIEIVDPIHWHHVESESNPADLASRGLLPQDLIGNDLWWHGPSWLQESENFWPNCSPHEIQDTSLERKVIKVNFSYFQEFDDILERFSSFSRALRVIAYVYRFFYRTHPKYKSSFAKNSVVITSSEIVAVRDRLISMNQKAWFPKEYKALSSRLSLPSSSTLLNLNPFMDQEGLIRSCGRLESSPGLSYNERHPIIIPYNCQYSRLLVKFVHDITLHGGNQLVLRSIRTQYWIPKVKNLIKTTINKCKPCIIYKKKCQKQIMAALPPERSEISRPLTHTGLDFAGPFDNKSYSGRACRITKGYVCVFVCFSTKAIHLEATSDLTTASFLAAFNRFVSRRGCPLHLHSDNGTTFVGASRVLAKEFIQTSHQAITSNYAHQHITWHFIPPGAPHMGGLWEAGVKSFKTHFRKISGCFKFTFEEFSTLLSKIEACLNSRPLSPLSQDPSDFSALTPGHFLIGSPILSPIDPEINEPATSIVNRWHRLKFVHQNFCTRWKNEYLKELQKRVKWQKPEKNIPENALVVIKDESLPPNSWRLGRVERTYYGSDKRVRVADVFTQKGLRNLPITKLVVLSSE